MPAYDPNDPVQSAFLAHVRQTESGGNYAVGYGGADLSSAPAGLFGFPLWSGAKTDAGPTHAAGAYQFQPSTWQRIASKLGLNFGNKSDQDQAAWEQAQADYKRNTGSDLYSALKSGDLGSVKDGLGSTWTSIKNWTALAQSPGGELAPGQSSGAGTPSLLSNPTGALGAYFVRGSMIMIGALILLVALWALLSHSGVTPKVSLR